MTPYKVQMVQELKPIDHPMRFRCDRLTEDGDFGKKNIFSDEAHFGLGGYEAHRTHALKSRRTQNESLFGTDFGPDA